MEYLPVKSTKFEVQKENIKSYALEQKNNNYVLNTVKSKGGLFNAFNHKVTGDEMNNLTVQIQSFFVQTNQQLISLTEKFYNVYELFEAVDTDYIKRFDANFIIATEAINKALDAQSEQENIINVVQSTVDNIVDFKERLEKIEHLTNLDELWNQVQNLYEKIDNFKQLFSSQIEENNQEIEKIDLKLDSLDKRVSNNSEEVKKIEESFILTTKDLTEKLSSINNIIDQFKLELESFAKKSDVESILSLCESQEQKIAKLKADNNNLNEIILFQSNEHKEIINSLKKKLKNNLIINYSIFGTIGLAAMVHLILNLLGIL